MNWQQTRRKITELWLSAGRHKCAACCGDKKGKVVKGGDEVVVQNADLHNAKQGGLISKALNRTANKENAWSPEEQQAFRAQVWFPVQ